MIQYGTLHEIFVPIASASSEGSVELAHTRKLDCNFSVRINEVWIQMKAKTKILTSSFAGYVSMHFRPESRVMSHIRYNKFFRTFDARNQNISLSLMSNITNRICFDLAHKKTSLPIPNELMLSSGLSLHSNTPYIGCLDQIHITQWQVI